MFCASRHADGAWPSGKAAAFDAAIRRFEPCRPSQFKKARKLRFSGFFLKYYGTLDRCFLRKVRKQLFLSNNYRCLQDTLGVPKSQVLATLIFQKVTRNKKSQETPFRPYFLGLLVRPSPVYIFEFGNFYTMSGQANLSSVIGNRDLIGLGWCGFHTGESDCDKLSKFMTKLGNQLGQIRPTRKGAANVDVLTPVVQGKAKPSSLSKKYGHGAFPLHCDTAYWPTPCQYIVLGCLNAGDSPTATQLLDTQALHFDQVENTLIQNSIFLVRNGRNSFYSSIQSPSRRFTRFDLGCMEPQCEAGKRAIELLSFKRNLQLIISFDWQVGAVVVIDNWRMLHGREEHVPGGELRKLLRVTVQ